MTTGQRDGFSGAQNPPWVSTVRGLRVSLHLCVAVLMAAVAGLSFGRIAPEPLARWWLERLLRIMNIRVHWHGVCATDARLIVANHVSWLDIAVIGSSVPARFVAKQEVRDWPLIGWLAQAAGAFFIRRGSGGVRPLLERLYPYLSCGGSLVLFPEGTTTDGSRLRPFHARLFEAAVSAQIAVQPVVLHYRGVGDAQPVAPFVGDDAFLPHLLRLLRTPSLDVDARWLDAVPAAAQRDVLCDAAHARIAAALAAPVTGVAHTTPVAPDLRAGAPTR